MDGLLQLTTPQKLTTVALARRGVIKSFTNKMQINGGKTLPSPPYHVFPNLSPFVGTGIFQAK